MRTRVVPIVLASFLAGLALAASHPTRSSVTLTRPTSVGEKILPAGTYRLELNAETARFIQGKRTLAESPVKVAVDKALYAGTAVHSRTVDGQERLVRIVLGGSGLALEFPTEAGGSTAGAVAATADRP